MAITPATSDFAVGTNRFTFLVVNRAGELVQSPRARVLIAREGQSRPASVTAQLIPLPAHRDPPGAAPHDHPNFTDLYRASVALPKPGRYWLVVEPEGESTQAFGLIEARLRSITPPVGSKAIASANPTLADAPAKEITTARPPDTELLHHSVKDSLRQGVPFVLVFATPRFCQTRACGPTVDVVDHVRRRINKPRIRFIHVEIYEGNDPQKGVNRWVKEWNLPTEPWVFVVDGKGIIRAKFEGSVAVAELERAVRENLL